MTKRKSKTPGEHLAETVAKNGGKLGGFKAEVSLAKSHPKSGKCIGTCGKVLTDGDFCFGCRSFICDTCDHQHPGAMGSHDKEAHLHRPSDLGDDW